VYNDKQCLHTFIETRILDGGRWLQIVQICGIVKVQLAPLGWPLNFMVLSESLTILSQDRSRARLGVTGSRSVHNIPIYGSQCLNLSARTETTHYTRFTFNQPVLRFSSPCKRVLFPAAGRASRCPLSWSSTARSSQKAWLSHHSLLTSVHLDRILSKTASTHISFSIRKFDSLSQRCLVPCAFPWPVANPQQPAVETSPSQRYENANYNQ
jgi:hypothetical protein